MTFQNIETLTYIANTVIVDGRELEVTVALDATLTAVQFHAGRDFCLEEPLMVEVPLTKYQFALDAFETASVKEAEELAAAEKLASETIIEASETVV